MTSIEEHTPLALAFRLADPSLSGALLARLRHEALPLLRRAPELPAHTVEAIVAAGDRELRTALARNREPGGCSRAARLRLAASGDPQIGHALYRTGYALQDPGLQAAVLAAADPAEPDWSAPGGLVETLLGLTEPRSTTPPLPLLAPALKGPFPHVVAAALPVLAPYLPLTAVLEACGSLLAHAGAQALTELAGKVEDACHPGLAELLREAAAAPDPAAVLHDRQTPGEWADPAALDVLLRLRQGRTEDDDRMPVHIRLDWDAVRGEHRRRQFSEGALAALSQWPDCPEDLVLEAFRTDPWKTAAKAARLPIEALAGGAADGRRFDAASFARRGIEEWAWPVERVLAEVGPARSLLAELPYDQEPVRAAVTQLLAPLGTDHTAWLTLYKRLPRFQGSAAALIANVCASGSRRTTTWPRPQDVTFSAVEPTEPRAVFLRLLGCVAEEVQLALVPHLDRRMLQQLLVFGSPTQRVQDEAVAVHGPVMAEAQIAGSGLWDRVPALLDRDDPRVNARLFETVWLTREQRARILAGVGRDGTRVPLDDRIPALLKECHLGENREWITAGIASGDPEVVDIVLARIRLYTEAGRLRVVIALWERQGPDAVREILRPARFTGHKHPWPQRTQHVVHQALDAPEGLKDLRVRLAAEEEPAHVAAYLRNGTADTVGIRTERIRNVVQEGGELPWAELVRANADTPLPDGLLAALTERSDCPRELYLELLRRTALLDELRPWGLRSPLREGTITTADLLRHLPVAEDLLYFATDAPPEAWARGLVEARKLTRQHLGTDVEAWAVALRLLPGFQGTLPELLATAAAVVG
ncbi:hypothetical protein ACWD6P_04765 [Streptomyces sp. NPDC002446]